MSPSQVNLTVRGTLHAILLLCLFIAASHPVLADEQAERRLQIALNLFPNIISLDQHLEQKLDADGRLNLLFIYEDNIAHGNQSARALTDKVTGIRQHPIICHPVALSALQSNAQPASALFITEQLGDQSFERLLDYAIARHLLLFSPFAGDVERGAAMGISVSSKILPYYNPTTLERSQIRLHPMLLRVAKRHEE